MFNVNNKDRTSSEDIILETLLLTLERHFSQYVQEILQKNNYEQVYLLMYLELMAVLFKMSLITDASPNLFWIKNC